MTSHALSLIEVAGLATLLILLGIAIVIAAVALLLHMVNEAKIRRQWFEQSQAADNRRAQILEQVISNVAGPAIEFFVKDFRRDRSEQATG